MGVHHAVSFMFGQKASLQLSDFGYFIYVKFSPFVKIWRKLNKIFLRVYIYLIQLHIYV